MDDDGPGIPPAELEAVFQPFRRLEASRNRETGGAVFDLELPLYEPARRGATPLAAE